MIQKIIVVVGLLFASLGWAQTTDISEIETQLTAMAETKEGLNETVRIDISGLTLYDFITSIAEEHELNVSVDNKLNEIVNSNFFDVPVSDVFLFLVREYNLEVSFLNSIISFREAKPEEKKPEPKKEKPIDISYKKENNFLSVKLKKDSLPLVAEKITELSNKNVVLAPDVKEMKVSAYIINRPFDQVMEMMAKSNDLIATVDENGFYFLEKGVPEEAATANNAGNSRGRRNRNGNSNSRPQASGQLEVSRNPNGYLKVNAYDADLNSIITQAAKELDLDYFLYDVPSDKTMTLVANEIDFESLLDHAFKGSEYTYNTRDEVYVIGKQSTEGLRTTELIQLENRTIELVLASLPATLTENVDVKEITELNGIIAAGSKPRIDELKDYIREIDKVVPMVQIDVLIVQYQKSSDVSTGLRAILGPEGQTTQTQGVLFPETDVTLNSNSINDLIDGFNGFGIFKLGKVTKDFYANLSALESNSIIKLQSTPKIATLSGHEASISIGETSYYFEQSNRLINSGVNNNILQSGQWKSTEANLAVNIKPYVSKNEHVTLTIRVEKSAFLGRAGENAPPGKATQQFESLVRVKNDEMVLLGGLDELDRENSGSGTPWISRVPVLKWFFSSRRKSKSKKKLHVFVKPTIVY